MEPVGLSRRVACRPHAVNGGGEHGATDSVRGPAVPIAWVQPRRIHPVLWSARPRQQGCHVFAVTRTGVRLDNVSFLNAEAGRGWRWQVRFGKGG